MGYIRGRTAASVALAVTLAAAATAVVVLRSPQRADAAIGNRLIEVHQGGGGDLWYHNVAGGTSPPTWGGSVRYVAGGGYRPAVTANGSVVVEAHQRGTGVGELAAMVGLRKSDSDLDTVAWYSDQTFASGSNPSIAVNASGTVVVCYDKGSNQVYYRVGIVAGGHLDWGAEQTLEAAAGMTASVALNDNGLVFVVFTGVMGTSEFTGRLSGNTIVKTGTTSGMNTRKGTVGSVAVRQNTVVEVLANVSGELWYRVGAFSNGDVNFASEGLYDFGANPSITIEPNTRKVLEVHESGDGQLWTHPGMLNLTNNNITWGTQSQYDWGAKPAIAG
jgi:hypothetical protein